MGYSALTILMLAFFATWAPPETRSAGDPAGIEMFADDVMASTLAKYGIPGGVLVIVQDGRVLVAKGYGLADLERRLPMGASTLLPVASVSKVVTATAVMQLVEQGRLGLDDDVNEHLRAFQIPPTFPEPVRIANLLTHTSGFDEGVAGTMSKTPDVSLVRSLATNLPPRIAAPGRMWLYSNHGIALAGRIVEVVSGKPFAEYMATHIFAPLGMRSSSFRLTPELKARVATGYGGAGAARVPWPLEYTHLAPAAALVTTGVDMAQFINAHLEGGISSSGRILREDTVRLMHARHFAVDPRGAGMAYGFYEQFPRGVRAVLHDGDWPGYSSRLLLVPEKRLGVFVSFNIWSAEARADVVRQVVGRFIPWSSKATGTASSAAPFPATSAVAGVYRWNRYPHQGAMKLTALRFDRRIRALDDRTLDVAGVRYTSAEPGIFRQVDGDGRLIVAVANGEVRQIAMDSSVESGFVILEPVAWYARAGFHLALSRVLRLVAATSFLWVVVAAVRLRRKGSAVPPAARRARVVAVLAAIPVSASPLWVGPLLRAVGYGSSVLMRPLSYLPAILAILTVLLCYYAIASWKRRFWSLFGRIHYSLVTAAVLVYLICLAYWNLLWVPLG